MKNYRVSSRATALVVTAFSAMTGCADLGADDSAADDARGAADLAQQFVPPSNAGELDGANIKIESIDATGKGCPAGSWTAEKVPEGTAFTLTFEKYVIEAPASSTLVSSQLNCDVNLKIRTPKDLSYAVTSFQFYGYANLSEGMKASLDAEYFFAGNGIGERTAPYHYDLPVPFDTTYAVNDDVEARGVAPSWSACDVSSTLTIRTRLTLANANPDKPGILAMDNIDARAKGAMKVNIRTRSCPGR